MKTFAFFVAFGLLWFWLSVLYQSAIRPVLNDRARFRLFRLRDELRSRGMNGEWNVQGFPYLFMEARLNRLIKLSHGITLGHILEFFILNPTPTRSKAVIRFEQEAPDELRRLDQSAMESLIWSVMVNSPGWVALSGALGLIGSMFGWVLKNWVLVHLEFFTEATPLNSSAVLA